MINSAQILALSYASSLLPIKLQLLIPNLVHNLPKMLRIHPNLYFRSLSNCGLEQVIEIGKGKGLIRSLDLSNNKINKIRSLNFAGWQSLDTLDLTNNELRLVFKFKSNSNLYHFENLIKYQTESKFQWLISRSSRFNQKIVRFHDTGLISHPL